MLDDVSRKPNRVCKPRARFSVLQGTAAIDSDVVNLGCGDGKVTAEIAGRLPQGSIIAIDNSAAMIALANRQYPSSRYPNMVFKLRDARELAFSGQFDAVLHWVKDHRPVLEGIFKCLKPGGRILLQMGAKDGVSLFISVLDQVRPSPNRKIKKSRLLSRSRPNTLN